MNQPSVRQEFDTIFDEDMAELNKLYSMTEKLEGRLKVMKETYEKAMQTQYENGYIQGFRDRYEGIQPRYKDINEKAIEWYDYSSMEMYRLHEVKFDSLESNIERLQDDNYQLYKENQNLAEILDENETTIKRVQVERDEFNLALRKAEDDMMTLRARSHDIQKDSQRTNDDMIDLKKKCHKFSCQLQDDIHILKEEDKENQETIKRLQLERYEFEVALVKVQNELMEWRREEKEEMMNLMTRNCLLLKENKENQEKMKRLESHFQSSVMKAETLQTNIYYNSKDV